ncbi:site-specific integrase [Streptococcus suis]|uniref:site-specific integrase n=1 Tax=Streptococcus suis TaxID=1307 RepID=UPI0038BDCA78
MITKYKKKNGETAYKFVAYLGVDPVTGKQVRTTRQGFKTEREAKRAEMKLIEQYENQGAWKKNNATTFHEVAQLWFEQYQNTVKPSTYLTTENNYNIQIKPFLGHVKIDKVSVLICQKLVNHLSQFRSYGSYLSLVNRILKFAVNISVIDVNPMDKTIRARCSYRPKTEEFDNYYNKEELNKFLDIVEKYKKPRDLVMYRILAYGGLRIGELLALDDIDFDFKNNTIRINKTIARTKAGLVEQEPKTKKSKRTISMDAETMRLAKEYYKTLPRPIRGTIKMFPIQAVSLRESLNKTIKKHHLKPITLHGFRHTHASLLFEAGVPAKMAQERLGHAKISITMDLYTHLSKTQKNDVVDKLSTYIAS